MKELDFGALVLLKCGNVSVDEPDLRKGENSAQLKYFKRFLLVPNTVFGECLKRKTYSDKKNEYLVTLCVVESSTSY